MKNIITMYKWAGSWGPFRIKSACKECDISQAVLDRLVAEDKDCVEVEYKDWLPNWYSLLKYGAWHAPIVLINNKLYSQGKEVKLKRIKEFVNSEC